MAFTKNKINTDFLGDMLSSQKYESLIKTKLITMKVIKVNNKRKK